MSKDIQKRTKQIFKEGSKTFFNSSLFFPKEQRERIFGVYAYLRSADNYVDRIPQLPKKFYKLKEDTSKALKGEKVKDDIVTNFVRISDECGFDNKWTDAFLESMAMDLDEGKIYRNIEDTLKYIYGSAEVIGLYVAKCIGLPDKALPYAGMLGRAFQYINFIRDIAEDQILGRNYFPQDELKKYGLKDLDQESALAKPDGFEKFIRAQIDLYREWQIEGEKGFKYIPKRLLVPIKTSSQMFVWTANEIYKDPFIVYKAKVKPRRTRIFGSLLINTF